MSTLIKQQLAVVAVFLFCFFAGVFISSVAVVLYDSENSLLVRYFDQARDNIPLLSRKTKRPGAAPVAQSGKAGYTVSSAKSAKVTPIKILPPNKTPVKTDKKKAEAKIPSFTPELGSI